MKSRRWLRATNSNSNWFIEFFLALFQEAYKMLIINKRKRGASSDSRCTPSSIKA